jgi:uncharacterized membrane protein YfcA
MIAAILYVLVGALVGGLIGLTGIGGGSLLTPILIFGFGQSPPVAVGTALAAAATTKLAVTGPISEARRVDWGIAARLAVGSVPAALGVLLWLWLAPRPPAFLDGMIVHLLGALLALTGAAILFQSPLRLLGLRTRAASLPRMAQLTPYLTVMLGVIVGVMVTLSSIGAGALASAALLYLYPLRLTGERLVATDIAYALPLAIIAALGHAALGHLDGTRLGLLLLGSVPAAVYAHRSAWRVPPALFRPGMAAILIGWAAHLLAT